MLFVRVRVGLIKQTFSFYFLFYFFCFNLFVTFCFRFFCINKKVMSELKVRCGKRFGFRNTRAGIKRTPCFIRVSILNY